MFVGLNVGNLHDVGRGKGLWALVTLIKVVCYLKNY